MSGHSKWSKVKHQKESTDSVKAAAFTKASRAITVAVREGGSPDPASNFHLRLAIEKARSVNMPKENIARAIANATGEGGSVIESYTYEGYAPGGVALLIVVATDNKNRAVALLKQILEFGGGSLVSPGAASYLFIRNEKVLTPTMTIPLEDHEKQKVLDIIRRLEELDDVQTVYTNLA